MAIRLAKIFKNLLLCGLVISLVWILSPANSKMKPRSSQKDSHEESNYWHDLGEMMPALNYPVFKNLPLNMGNSTGVFYTSTNGPNINTPENNAFAIIDSVTTEDIIFEVSSDSHSEEDETSGDKTVSLPEKDKTSEDKTDSLPQEDKTSGDKTDSLPEDDKTSGDKTDSLPEEDKTPGDKTDSLPEKDKISEDDTDSLQEENKTSGDKTDSLPEEDKTPEDKTDSLPEEDKTSEDKTDSLPNEDKTSGDQTDLLPKEVPGPNATGDGKTFYGRSIPEHPTLQYDMESPNMTHPWKDDNNCSKFAVRLGKGLPFIYLISFPRSGNSWTRYLLEGATGFFTGSVYNDQKLYEMGYLGEVEEPSNGTTLFIKTHIFKADKIDPTMYPVVLVIRNPRNSIESLVSFKTTNGTHSYEGSQEDFKALDRVFKGYLESWERIATLILENTPYLHVVIYEDLKADPINEIRKILKFVGIPGDPERLACLAKYSEGSMNRGQPEYNPFSAEQKASMAAAVRRTNTLVVKRGFPPLPFVDEQDTSA